VIFGSNRLRKHHLKEQDLIAPTMTKQISLSQLRPGQRATIIRVGGKGQMRRRFMEMGFVRGEDVRVERVAPLGDPIEYVVKGYHLSLRRADTEGILVEIDGGESTD
jgi:ferrous iron transport protein A